MIKILAICVLIYFFFRSLGFIIRMMLGGRSDSQNPNRYAGRSRSRSGKGLHVDREPQVGKKRTDFKGGDYVDYEEIEK